MENNLKKLTRLLAVMDENSLTREEFTNNFKILIDFVKELKRTNNLEMESLNSKYTEIVNSIKENYGGDMQGMKQGAMDYCVKEIDKLIGKVDTKMANLRDGVDGLDASVDEVALKASTMAQDALKPLLPTIEQIEADLPKLGGSIASALELLPEGDKLKLDAIEGLKDLLEELRQLKGGRMFGGGGGFSKSALELHIIDNEELAGTVDGVNTIFTINHTPSPYTSLHIKVGTVELYLTEDWTISNKTITFLTAPPVRPKADYRR